MLTPGFATAWVVGGSAPAASAQFVPEPEAKALIERIETHHRSLPHFSARFEQRFQPRIFGRERVETGRLTVKRPARMRWDYETPTTKVFVSDGTSTWFHVPEDQQVVVGAFEGGADGEPNPLELLTGEASILDHFDVLLGPSPEDGLRTISLVPRGNGEIASVSLVVESVSGEIRSIGSEDPEGNRTTFQFSDFRSDSVPDDRLFTFTIPPGTEVVTAAELRP